MPQQAESRKTGLDEAVMRPQTDGFTLTIPAQQMTSLSPQELFLLVISRAIDSSVEILADAGIEEDRVWSALQQSLNVIVQSTLEVDDAEDSHITAIAA